MDLPPLRRVVQRWSQPRLDDVRSEVRRQVAGSRIAERVRPGGEVAVAVGSRGIGRLVGLVAATTETLSEMGFRPFIVPAMGSHGGATADGQAGLLADLGISRGTIGVEIRSSMETVVLGRTSAGQPIHFDANAARADGLVLVARVKPHTDFQGRYESGLVKMLAVGLGKRDGAEQIHKLGLRGLTEVLPEVGAHLISRSPLALGLAVVENADDEPAIIEAIEPDRILDAEPTLLDRARGWMGRLPFDQIDVLIVCEMGKNFSGSGLDPNVIGRVMLETRPDLDRPKITRIAVLDLSPESRGNAVGVGFADLVTDRLVASIDPAPMRANVLTASFLERARVPISLPTDRLVAEAAVETCWRADPAEARVVLIPNTLELRTLWTSPALDAEVDADPLLDRSGPPRPWPFLADDRLDRATLFPGPSRGG